MDPPLLFSTNAYLKYLIQLRFRGDVHYVWCSEYFDSNTLSRYAAGAGSAPSSNPADIYRQLSLDVTNKDRHSLKISAQKASLTKLAINWERNGEITSDEKAEIIFMVDNAAFDDWRPLLYVIPRSLVSSRIKIVPIHLRASYGVEYIVEDLKRTEFEILEI